MKSDATSRKFPASPEEWEALIAAAPGEDRPPTAEEEAAWSKGVVVREGGPPAVHAALARRRYSQSGNPKKTRLSIPFSPEVVDYFRATGEGWQLKMDEALKEWMQAHPRQP